MDNNYFTNDFLIKTLDSLKNGFKFGFFGLLVFGVLAGGVVGFADETEDEAEDLYPLNKVYVSEINYFGRRATGDDNCRADGNLAGINQCGFDKWVELYNPTDSVADFNEYGMFFSFYGGDIASNQRTRLEGLTIQPNSRVVIYNSRSSLVSIIPQKSNDIFSYATTNVDKISTLEGNQYINIAFYIAKNEKDKPILDFSLPNQPNPTDTFKTLEFCSAEAEVTEAKNLYYKDSDENKYYANPGRDCTLINQDEGEEDSADDGSSGEGDGSEEPENDPEDENQDGSGDPETPPEDENNDDEKDPEDEKEDNQKDKDKPEKDTENDEDSETDQDQDPENEPNQDKHKPEIEDVKDEKAEKPKEEKQETEASKNDFFIEFEDPISCGQPLTASIKSSQEIDFARLEIANFERDFVNTANPNRLEIVNYFSGFEGIPFGKNQVTLTAYLSNQEVYQDVYTLDFDFSDCYTTRDLLVRTGGFDN